MLPFVTSITEQAVEFVEDAISRFDGNAYY